MNREEAARHFEEEVVTVERQHMLLMLDTCLQRDQEQLIEAYLSSFQALCRQIREAQLAGRKGAISYITYSFLRTEIVAGRAYDLVEAADHRWFLDSDPIRLEYDAGWAFGVLDQMMERLEQAARFYMGKIASSELQRIRMRECEAVHRYVAALIRAAMPEAVKTAEYMELQREDIFEIRAGEYCDTSECVYREDKRQLVAANVKDWLSERNLYDYTYNAFGELELQRMICDELDFRYTAFRGTQLDGTSFKQGILLGTSWQSCSLRSTDFTGSVVSGAKFDGCCLREAVLRGITGSSGRLDPAWRGPALEGVSFRDCDLTGADLRDAWLEGADLRGACLDGVDLRGAQLAGILWTGASLEGTILNEDALAHLDLRQVKGIPQLRSDEAERQDMIEQIKHEVLSEKEGIH